MTERKYANITVFTKPDCMHCARTKELLKARQVPFAEVDVTKDGRDAQLSVYMSNQVELPQVFVAGYPLGGADDIHRLDARGVLEEVLRRAVQAPAPDNFPVRLADEDLQKAVENVDMSKHIEGRDGTRATHPEDVAVLHFYKMFFGWWPDCFLYLYRYPEAYRYFVFDCNVAGAQPVHAMAGDDLVCLIAAASSEAHGCGYCQVHVIAKTGSSIGLIHQYRLARDRGGPSEDGPIDEFTLAAGRLAAAATTNDVTPEMIRRVRDLKGDDGDNWLAAIARMAAVFGFLNTFNDLTSVEIEGGWNSQVQNVMSVKLGKHARSDDSTTNPDNLNFELPPAPPIPEILKSYREEVGDPVGYMGEKAGLFPNWLAKWNEEMQFHHAHLYGNLVCTDGPSMKISAELKHLIARVSAVARMHDYLAAVEGYMAWHAAGDKDAAAERIDTCYAAALGLDGGDAPFTAAERAALACAVSAASIPMVTLEKAMGPLREHYDDDEIVQVFAVCAIAGMLQRFCAVTGPEMEAEVGEFYRDRGLSTALADIRFPHLSGLEASRAA